MTLYFPQHCPASWGPNLTSPASEVINKARAASEKNLGAKKYLPTDLLLEVLLFLLLLLFVQMGPAGHWELLDQPFHLPTLLLPLLSLQLFEAAPVIDHPLWTWVGGEHGGNQEERARNYGPAHNGQTLAPSTPQRRSHRAAWPTHNDVHCSIVYNTCRAKLRVPC